MRGVGGPKMLFLSMCRIEIYVHVEVGRWSKIEQNYVLVVIERPLAVRRHSFRWSVYLGHFLSKYPSSPSIWGNKVGDGARAARQSNRQHSQSQTFSKKNPENKQTKKDKKWDRKWFFVNLFCCIILLLQYKKVLWKLKLVKIVSHS